MVRRQQTRPGIGRVITAGLLTATVIGLGAQHPESAAARLEAARQTEIIAGDLAEAIRQYEAIVAAFGQSNRPVAARALLATAQAYERLGDAKAGATYEQVLRHYGDQEPMASEARARAARLVAAVRPPSAVSQAGGPTIRQAWTGADVNLNGRVARDGRYLSVAVWGRALADPYARRAEGFGIRDLVTGETRVLVPAQGIEYPEHSIFSRDGTKLAYVWGNAKGRYDLRVIDRNGGTPRVLYELPAAGWIMPFDWSPDESLIAVWVAGEQGGTRLGLISTSDGSLRALKTFERSYPANMSFSPDGRFIAYDVAPGDGRARDIFIVTADSTREVAAVDHPAHDSLLGWFPDGSRLLFTSDRSGTNDVYAIGVREGRPDGDPLLLRRHVGEVHAPMGFTEAGEFLFGVQQVARDVLLATLDPATGLVMDAPKPLQGFFSGNRDVATWSPDGRHLAVLSRLPNELTNQVLSVYTAASGEMRTVPHGLSYFVQVLFWSPDGRAVFLEGVDRLRRTGLHRVDVETGETESLGIDSGRHRPRALLSPDGQSLFHVPARQDADFTRLDLATGRMTALHPSSPIAFALSRDGRQIAMLLSQDRPGGVTPPGAAQEAEGMTIALMPVEGGVPREIVSAVDLAPTLAWDGAGGYVYFAERSGAFWRVRVADGSAEALAVRIPGLSHISLSPDGRQLAVTTSTNQLEVLALGNLGIK